MAFIKISAKDQRSPVREPSLAMPSHVAYLQNRSKNCKNNLATGLAVTREAFGLAMYCGATVKPEESSGNSEIAPTWKERS